MSKITNNSGLPAAIVSALTNDTYDRGESDITVTQLISPPRKVTLETEHHEEIEEDAADLIFALLGSSVHTILERAALEGIVEERFYKNVLGWRIGGQVDHLSKHGILTDYKVMSIYEGNNGLKQEKEQQLNLLACLARENGHEVKGLQIVSIYRDWSKSKARRGDAPSLQVEVHPITMWSGEEANRFLEERVAEHQKARIILPNCTDEERWMDPPTFAIMKEGNKRALRLQPTREAAQLWAVQNKLGTFEDLDMGEEVFKLFEPSKGIYIEERTTPPRRCMDYCKAAQFCEQWAKYKEEHNIKE